MDYNAAVHYLLSLGRELAAPTQASAAKFHLENIRVLAERLDNPQRAYPSAHIAVDEANAPELFSSGAKLVTVDGPVGKIDVEARRYEGLRMYLDRRFALRFKI